MKAVYPSKYTDKKIGPSQYLADEIMERIAKKEGKTLPYKYWSLDQWKKIYLHQVTAAGKLLQECDPVAIMAFLRSVKGRKIYSLGLRKQILAGTREYNTSTTICIELPEIKEIETLYNEEIFTDEDIEVDMEYNKRGDSLWEKLS